MIKKCILKLAAFAVILLGIDVAFGKILDSILLREDGKQYYMTNKINEEILIMGSSRAERHYVPSIMLDTLGKRVYNCGMGGMGIIYNYENWKIINQRYHPKMVIYDITPTMDVLDKYSNIEHQMTSLIVYYNNGGCVSEILKEMNWKTRVKMYSSLYRGSCIPLEKIIKCLEGKDFDICGYRPLNGIIKPIAKKVEETEAGEDSLKLQYWEKFLSEADEYGTRVIFSVSPMYYIGGPQVVYGGVVDSVAELTSIQALREKYEIPLLSMERDEDFFYREDFFYDKDHLNDKGAEAFTKDFCSRYKEILLQGIE